MIKGVSETIENKAKEQKGAFLSMLLGTLGASLLRHLLQVKKQQQRVEKRLQLLMELYEHVMKQLGRNGIFNATSSFDEF